MRERRLDINLAEVVWRDDGRTVTIFELSFDFDPDRNDTALFGATLAVPFVALYLYSNRWPSLSIEYARGRSGSLLWMWQQWRVGKLDTTPYPRR